MTPSEKLTNDPCFDDRINYSGYAVYDENGCIAGIGLTETSAWVAARSQSIDQKLSFDSLKQMGYTAREIIITPQ